MHGILGIHMFLLKRMEIIFFTWDLRLQEIVLLQRRLNKEGLDSHAHISILSFTVIYHVNLRGKSLFNKTILFVTYHFLHSCSQI